MHVKKNSQSIQEELLNYKKLKADLGKQLSAFYNQPQLLSPNKPLNEDSASAHILTKNPALDHTCYNCKIKKVNHFVKELDQSDVILEDSFMEDNDIEITSS